MRKEYKQLTYEDRCIIFKLLKQQYKVKEIAEVVEVHPATIYRELKRGQVEQIDTHFNTYQTYDPYTAEKRSKENRQKRGANLKLMLECPYLEFVREKIMKDKFSPRAIVLYIKINNIKFDKTLSDFSIYRYIRLGLIDGLNKNNLHYKIKKSKYRHRCQKKGANGVSIEKRPDIISMREEFGHWEMDSVVGKQGKSQKTLLVLTERMTRFELIFLLDNHTTSQVVSVIDNLEKYLKKKFYKIFKTITVDNGTEFADNENIVRSIHKDRKRLDLYYCHPYCSCERGSNENANRLIRYFIPKGTNFDSKSKDEIKAIQNWINNYPRKLFNGQNSNSKIINELKKLKINPDTFLNIA